MIYHYCKIVLSYAAIIGLCVCTALAIYILLDIPADTSLEPKVKVSLKEKRIKKLNAVIEDNFRTKYKMNAYFDNKRKGRDERCRNLPLLKYASTDEFMIVNDKPAEVGECEVFDIKQQMAVAKIVYRGSEDDPESALALLRNYLMSTNREPQCAVNDFSKYDTEAGDLCLRSATMSYTPRLLPKKIIIESSKLNQKDKWPVKYYLFAGPVGFTVSITEQTSFRHDALLKALASMILDNPPGKIPVSTRYTKAKYEAACSVVAKDKENERIETERRWEEQKRKEILADYEKLRSEFLAGINDFLPYRWRWTKPENTYKHFIQTHFGDGELYSDAALAKNECIGKVPLMGIRKRFPVQESKNKVTEKDILSEFSNLKALVYKPFTTEHGFEFPRGFVNYCGIRDKNDIKKVHDYIIGVIYCDSKAQARDALIYMILNRPSVRDASPLVAETIRRDDLALGDIAFSCKGEILDDLTTKKDTNNSQIYFIRNNTAVIVKSMRKDDSVLDTARWIDEMLKK